MSSNNWVEGEFQQIWEGWGVPCYSQVLSSLGVSALSQAQCSVPVPGCEAHGFLQRWGPPGTVPGAGGTLSAVFGDPLPGSFPGVAAWQPLAGSPAPSPGYSRLCRTGRPCCCSPGSGGPIRHRAAPLLGSCSAGCLGCWGSFAQPRPAACPGRAELGWPQMLPQGLRAPSTPRVWLIRRQRGYSRAVPPWALFFFSLRSLLFNEPTLEDLERRSCSFSVTYLPASAPYSAEGINLCSRRGAER